MRKIKYFVMDVDGTLTNGKIYMGNSGEVCKTFDIKDGYGINAILKEFRIVPVIITGRKSKIVENRCKELGIAHLYQGSLDKKSELEQVLRWDGEDWSDVLYVGDDLNDLEVMEKIKQGGGIVTCPADAVKEICKIADYVATKKGGDGAVREIIDWIVYNMGEVTHE